jgi:hypothetical protein
MTEEERAEELAKLEHEVRVQRMVAEIRGYQERGAWYNQVWAPGAFVVVAIAIFVLIMILFPGHHAAKCTP